MKARLGIALLSGAVLLAPAVGHATWSVDPVTVHATTDECPLVAAASDAQDGAIVVWQQDDAANPGVFRLLAKRLLANGDVDAAWPVAGAIVSTATVNRSALGALGDGNSGAYVWWMENASLYLTRILSNGTIAAGWAARGKPLGYLPLSTFRPLVFADGQGGIWLGWLAGAPLYTAGRITHLGPAGQGAGGWPDGARQYAVSSQEEEGLQTLAFTYAPAPDGGAWIAWGDAMYDADGYHAGSWRLLRTTTTGVPGPGWDVSGLPVRDFHGELLVGAWCLYSPSEPPYFAASPVALASDGADGVYLLLSDVTGVAEWAQSTPRLFHLDATGAAVPSWPAGGVVPYASGSGEGVDPGANCSLRLFAEVAGGVFALRPSYFSEGYIDLTLARFTPAATRTEWSGAEPNGLECIVPPSGETYLATCSPFGVQGSYSPGAYIHLEETHASGAAGPGFTEYHDLPSVRWYGDVGLAPTSGAGAILAWSQVRERQGVFARRFTAAGEVTGVPPGGPATQVLRLRFAPGLGVVATLGRVAGGRIQLHDVAGRVCAGTEVPVGAGEVTVEGTATLAPGLYFVRHRGADGATETARVVVIR